jgi:O-methyltransferase involved in polyketide biosynthesis
MYLTEKEIRKILDLVRSDSGPGSSFIFTYMEEKSEGDYQFRNASWIMSAWLKTKNERFSWGVKNELLFSFLEQSGLQLLEYKTHIELREEYITDANSAAALAIGENIAVAVSNQNI